MDHSNQILIPIKGYENLYSISIDGNIYSHVFKKFRKHQLSQKNVPYVRLSKNGIYTFHTIHKLIHNHFNIIPVKVPKIKKPKVKDNSKLPEPLPIPIKPVKDLNPFIQQYLLNLKSYKLPNIIK